MQFRIEGNLILAVGKDGEDFLEIASRLKEAKQTPQTMLVLSATGMLRKVKLGYWDGEKYQEHNFPQPMELLGISGFISREAEPFYHFHLTLADREGRVWGGHFLQGEVCNALELFLMGSSMKIKRAPVGKLKLITLE